MARSELEKRGLNEEEVRTRLLENGIDADHISPTEYPAYQDRVLRILNQMQAEKAAANQANNAAARNQAAEAANQALSATAADIPQTSMGEAAAEAQLEAMLEENHISPTEGNDIYGHSLFTGTSMSVFRTTDGAQAPDTYILGEGDEVHISIFGSSQTEIHQRIAADGSIQPAGSTKIFLKGMTLAQGRAAIQKKLAQHYSFRPDQIAVTISTARTVQVSIYGEVGIQGGFTLSALNSSFNALAAAGGPTALGSVRNIQLSRAGKTYRLDLYEYMRDPHAGKVYDLQNNDIFFVPVAQKIVRIEGSVNKPMRYEMIEGETLRDLIDYAGGLTFDVYPDFIQIERYDDGGKKYLEYDLNDIMSGNQQIGLVAGDIVRVRAANEPLLDYVAINGDVYYGGRYDLASNGSLKDLIEKAKPQLTARTDYVFVERTRPDETVEVLTVPFPGTNGNPDFRLEARDVVRVLEQSNYRDLATISVQGEVREPFTREFGLNDHMTVSQAIEYAGGLKPTVFPVAYIFRRDVSNPDRMEYLRVSLEKDGNQLLKPGDRLNVYDNSTYTNIGEVRISGAVKNPFATAYDQSISLHDLISMAGGFEVGAAYNKVEVFRTIISTSKEAEHDILTVPVDEGYNPLDKDFQLQPFDHVVVRRTPNFTTGRSVEINGRVMYPGVYVLEDNRTTLSQVLAMAGGLLNDAEPFIRIYRPFNGRGSIGLNLNKVHAGDAISNDPILMEGDVINVERQENIVTIRETGTRMAQYVSPDDNSTQKNVVFQGRRSAKWYINHCAGGFQRDADRNSVTVTLPNNQAEGTRRFLFFRIYPKVQPGSTIALRIDQEKIRRRQAREAREGQNVDWASISASTTSAITSFATLYILFERIKNN